MSKVTIRSLLALIPPAVLALLLGACGSDTAGVNPETLPPESRPPSIEESDLYKVSGSTLYVQNPSSGLNIIDIANPAKPRLVGRAATGTSAGAEMYIRESSAIVLLKKASNSCAVPLNMEPMGMSYGSELVFVDLSSRTHPRVVEKYCVPGELVASRTVGHVLYLVTTQSGQGSRAISIDLSAPTQAQVLQSMQFPNASKEIQVTHDAIFVAAEISNSSPAATDVSYISIDGSGTMKMRGSIEVAGRPQGRFHMSLHDASFRIVTYDPHKRHSNLHVIDVSEPDTLQITGKLLGIAPGEKLYATRFDGKTAYVVTFRRTDPLWIISLQDATKPRIVGELHVPGWSDFLFPRGKYLINVGRGDNGNGVGVSMFDVSDPKQPRVVDMITLGNSNATSEANVDHRAVTLIDQPGGEGWLVLVPHTTVDWSSSCAIQDRLELVDASAKGLQARGTVEQTGTIRRTLLVGAELYSISDYEVLALDIGDRDNPRVDTAVTVGLGSYQHPEQNSYCSQYPPHGGHVDYEDDSAPFLFTCQLGEGDAPALPPTVFVLGAVWLAGWLLRRRRRRGV